VLLARFSPDSEWIVTGTQSGTIRVWSTRSGKGYFSLTAIVGVSMPLFQPGRAVARIGV
jgi:WD40 repeat protein